MVNSVWRKIVTSTGKVFWEGKNLKRKMLVQNIFLWMRNKRVAWFGWSSARVSLHFPDVIAEYTPLRMTPFYTVFAKSMQTTELHFFQKQNVAKQIWAIEHRNKLTKMSVLISSVHLLHNNNSLYLLWLCPRNCPKCLMRIFSVYSHSSPC